MHWSGKVDSGACSGSNFENKAYVHISLLFCFFVRLNWCYQSIVIWWSQIGIYIFFKFTNFCKFGFSGASSPFNFKNSNQLNVRFFPIFYEYYLLFAPLTEHPIYHPYIPLTDLVFIRRNGTYPEHISSKYPVLLVGLFWKSTGNEELISWHKACYFDGQRECDREIPIATFRHVSTPGKETTFTKAELQRCRPHIIFEWHHRLPERSNAHTSQHCFHAKSNEVSTSLKRSP